MQKQLKTLSIHVFLFVTIATLTACYGGGTHKKGTIEHESAINYVPLEPSYVQNYSSTPVRDVAPTEFPDRIIDEESIETPVPSYFVHFVDTSFLLNQEDTPWTAFFSFNIVQVDGMANEELQKKVNESILEAMTYWIEDVAIFRDDIIGLIPENVNNPVIHFQSDRYLSISNYFSVYNPQRGDCIIDVITIDMRTGKRVMLCDLVEVNHALAERIIACTMLHGWASIPTPEKLLEKLQQASLDYFTLPAQYQTRIGAMMFRTSFHLNEHQLILTFHREGGLFMEDLNHTIIDLDSIKEFLLVEEW